MWLQVKYVTYFAKSGQTTTVQKKDEARTNGVARFFRVEVSLSPELQIILNKTIMEIKNEMKCFMEAFEKTMKEFGVNDAIQMMCGNVL